MNQNLNRINPLIFREYDVRGVVDTDLNCKSVYLLGRSIGTFIGNRGGKRIAIGRDNRTSSLELRDSLVKGITEAGCDVIDIGLSTSPLLYTAVIQWELDGGVNITGSHNPVQYNGFKIVRNDAIPLAGEEIKTLYNLIQEENLSSGIGSISYRDPKPEYFNRIENLIHLEKTLKVVVDTGNGVAGVTVPNFLRKIGCEVVELYCELDGSFPNHLPNPEHEKYMEDLKNAVIATNADIGMGFDGDGDRIGIIDEKGNFLSSDYTLILLARDFLSRNPGQKVLIDIKSSQNVEHDILNNAGIPVTWKTGHSLMKKKMREDNIILGGEFSGHMFVAENYFIIDDALYAASRILQMLSQKNGTVSNYFNDLPTLYSTPLLEVHVDETKKFDVVKQLYKIFSEKYDVIDIDGVKVLFPDGWGLVRASNTTPTLNLRMEADTPENLAKIRNIFFDILKKFPAIDIGEAIM